MTIFIKDDERVEKLERETVGDMCDFIIKHFPDSLISEVKSDLEFFNKNNTGELWLAQNPYDADIYGKTKALICSSEEALDNLIQVNADDI